MYKRQLLGSARNPADPLNVNTWNLTDFNYQYNISMVGEVLFNGTTASNTNDKVAAFIGNDLRGVGSVEMINEVDQPEVSFMIGGTAGDEEFTLYYFNADQNTVYEIDKKVSLDLSAGQEGSTGFGKYDDPYPIEVALFPITVFKEDVLCAADQSGYIHVVPVGAINPVTYSWAHDPNATTARIENLGPGTYVVEITDAQGIPVQKTIEITAPATNITPPTISGNQQICANGSLNLSASNSDYPSAIFNWFDEDNNILATNSSTLALTNLQASQSIKVIAVVNNVCFSDPAIEQLNVGQPVSANFTADNDMPAANTTVTFTPTEQVSGVTYTWDFGDMTTSTDMIAQHAYTTPGTYTVILTTKTTENCVDTRILLGYITVTNQTGDCDPEMTLINSIPAGVYQAANKITSDGQVEATTAVTFTAGTEILLTDGFHAKANSTFTAMIAACDPIAPDAPAETRVALSALDNKITSINELKIAPNPSAGKTLITYNLATEGNVNLDIYDARGKLVKRLIRDAYHQAGVHQLLYQSQIDQIGIYYLYLQSGTEVLTKKLIIVR